MSGLGYQIVWTRMFGLGLGHEMPAVLAVISAYFGGVALGAWGFDRSIGQSRRPERWYIGLELVIAAWACVSIGLVPWLNRTALSWIGLDPSAFRQWTVALLLPLIGLLPATSTLGATLAAMDRVAGRLSSDGRCVGSLYAVNTLGAVAGTLASAFVLLPWFGFAATLGLFAGLNLLAAIGTWALTRQTPNRRSQERDLPTVAAAPPGLSRRRLALTLVGTGFLGVGYEIVGVRLLNQVLENTVYTFAAVLSAYLIGISLGAAVEKRWWRRGATVRRLRTLLLALAGTVVLGLAAVAIAPSLYPWLRGRLGDGIGAVTVSELLVAGLAFGPATLLMGATFALLAQASRQSEGGVGWALGLNTLGATAAPAVMGVWLLPALGGKWPFILVAAGYAALAPRGGRTQGLVLALLLGLGFLLPAHLDLGHLNPGETVIHHSLGVADTVSVIETREGNRTLRVNGRFDMGGTVSAAAEKRHAHIPLLIHPAPRKALFLGVGTGISFGAMSTHPGLSADGVELVPNIVRAHRFFTPTNRGADWPGRLSIHTADARRFVRCADTMYDVIVADLFHPGRDGAAGLYTREHFAAIRDRLGRGGLFCQWLPLYQLAEPDLRLIVRTFLEVFPEGHGWLLRPNLDTPVLGLIGAMRQIRVPVRELEARQQTPELRDELRTLALDNAVTLLGGWLGDSEWLRELGGTGRINTDARPIIGFSVPRHLATRSATRLSPIILLADAQTDFGRIVAPASDSTALEARLRGDRAARVAYLEGLQAERAGQAQRATAQFLRSAELSPDFTLAYARCLVLASQFARTDPEAAERLLRALAKARPERRTADLLRERLFEPSTDDPR